MKFSVPIKAFCLLLLLFVSEIHTLELKETLEKNILALRRNFKGKADDEVTALRKSIKKETADANGKKCFNKKDYGFGIGLTAEFSPTIDGKKLSFKFPFEVKFEWDEKGKFVKSYKYPLKEASEAVTSWYNNRKNKKAGYGKLVEEMDIDAHPKKSSIIKTIKDSLPKIAKDVALNLGKWIIEKALKSLVAVFAPFLSPFIIVYDIYKMMSKFSAYSKKNEKKSTSLGHEITTYYLKYKFLKGESYSADGYLLVDVNKACIDQIFKKFKDFFSLPKKKLETLWALYKPAILKKDNPYHQLIEEEEDKIGDTYDEKEVEKLEAFSTTQEETANSKTSPIEEELYDNSSSEEKVESMVDDALNGLSADSDDK